MRNLFVLFFLSMISVPIVAHAQATEKNPTEEKTTNEKNPDEKTAVEKTTWIAEIYRTPEANQQIQGLSIEKQRIPISLRKKDGKLRPFVELRGNISDPEAKVFVLDGDTQYPIQVKNGSFILFFYLNSVLSDLALKVQSPKLGEPKEVFTVSAPDIQEYRIGRPWGTLLLGLGGANLRYQQTRFGGYASYNMMLAANYESPEWFGRFLLAGDFALTLWTLKSEPTNSAPQILTSAGMLMYEARDPKKKFQWLPILGMQYLTMFSNSSQLGFKNLMSPEGGVKLRYDLNEKYRLSARGLYSPLNGFLKKEFGAQLLLSASARVNTTHRLELSLVFDRQSYRASSVTYVDLSLLSFRLGYSI